MTEQQKSERQKLCASDFCHLSSGKGV